MANYLITDFISDTKSKDISVQSLYLKEILTVDDETKLIVNDESLIDRYRDDIYASAYYVTLTPAEKNKYFYKPWLFCYDRYGTTELWFELLKLNQLSSFSEFCLESMKVFSKSVIDRLQTILDMETPVIDTNKSLIAEAEKEASES